LKGLSPFTTPLRERRYLERSRVDNIKNDLLPMQEVPLKNIFLRIIKLRSGIPTWILDWMIPEGGKPLHPDHQFRLSKNYSVASEAYTGIKGLWMGGCMSIFLHNFYLHTLLCKVSNMEFGVIGSHFSEGFSRSRTSSFLE